jgi:hypothetical protein
MESARDPFANLHAIYDARFEQISDMFQTVSKEREWDQLATLIDEALTDPYLPRYYRAHYNIIRAMHAEASREEVLLLWMPKATRERQRCGVEGPAYRDYLHNCGCLPSLSHARQGSRRMPQASARSGINRYFPELCCSPLRFQL